jgi:short-subunit dehydrogenase
LVSTLQPVTLITGASAGIGRALAQEFAVRGHDLVLVARRAAELAAVADAIAAEGRPRPQVLAVDLGERTGPERIAEALAARGLEPQIVVNNAGFGLCGEAARLDRAQQLAMIDLNVRALTDLSLRWIESLARHRGGIINIASVSSFFPGPQMAVYYATKAYVLSFTEALRHELGPLGVRATVVCPGPVATEFHGRAGIAVEKLPRLFTRSAGRVARDAYEGFMQGRRIVLPGFPNKVAAVLPRLLPRRLMLAVVAAYQLQSSRADTDRAAEFRRK